MQCTVQKLFFTVLSFVSINLELEKHIPLFNISSTEKKRLVKLKYRFRTNKNVIIHRIWARLEPGKISH